VVDGDGVDGLGGGGVEGAGAVDREAAGGRDGAGDTQGAAGGDGRADVVVGSSGDGPGSGAALFDGLDVGAAVEDLAWDVADARAAEVEGAGLIVGDLAGNGEVGACVDGVGGESAAAGEGEGSGEDVGA